MQELGKKKHKVTKEWSYYEEIDWTDVEKAVMDVTVNVWDYKKLSSFKFARFDQKAKMNDVKKIGVVQIDQVDIDNRQELF